MKQICSRKRAAKNILTPTQIFILIDDLAKIIGRLYPIILEVIKNKGSLSNPVDGVNN